MTPIKRLRAYFWTIDPGHFYLKHAVKTVLAILISLILMRNESTLTKVIAGIISGASMQGLVAKSFSSRVAQIIIFDVVYFAALLLGFVIRSSPQWTAVTLVILGFSVNYVRRFGLDNSMAPMVAWVLCFLVTILPFSTTTHTGTLMYGVGVGFLISATVQLFVFPQNDARLFVNNSNRFLKTLAQGLWEMRRYVLLASEQVDFETLPFVLTKRTLEELLESNQIIQQDQIFEEEQKQIDHILMQQYALLNAYSLLVDIYNSLWLYKHKVSRPSVLALSYLSSQFARLFATTLIRPNYMVDAKYSPDAVPNLAEKLGKISFIDPQLIMALLNFKLGFELLKKHEIKLLRGVDET
jgi:hypothetical protein